MHYIYTQCSVRVCVRERERARVCVCVCVLVCRYGGIGEMNERDLSREIINSFDTVPPILVLIQA